MKSCRSPLELPAEKLSWEHHFENSVIDEVES